MEHLSDSPPGPLDEYRKKASFSWKKLRIALEGEEGIRAKYELWKLLEKDPVFAHLDDTGDLDQYRSATAQRTKVIHDKGPFTIDLKVNNPELLQACVLALGQYDWSLAAKYGLAIMMPQSTILGLGTKRHLEYAQKLQDFDIISCFALTELSHGSNTKAMQTTATYEPSSQQFILHSPSIEAAKCWIGNLGQTSTHAVVFAQLLTSNGINHGLHAFFVPVRDPDTRLPYPGVTIGDMGLKIGLNGIDNGFMMFNQYRIPRETLFNKTGDVTPEGQYNSPFKDPSKRFGASLGNLSGGRVSIVGMCVSNFQMALTIAFRYSAARKQFGPIPGKEIPVLEYQLQSWRLLPHLATCFALDVFSRYLLRDFNKFVKANQAKTMSPEELGRIGSEMHALSCCAKPMAGWYAHRAIQECREACGGHGYLASSRLGKIRNDNDGNLTYEGDNNVLLMQTSRYLVALWEEKQDVRSSLGYTGFIGRHKEISKIRGKPDQLKNGDLIEVGVSALEWAVLYLLRRSKGKLQQELSKGHDLFTATSNTQAYHLNLLAKVFVKLCILRKFWEFCTGASMEDAERRVMSLLCSLFAMSSLHEHLSTLYQGGYCYGEAYGKALEVAILNLCEKLKPECISLVDVIAPPDFILNSSLGQSDGQIYKNIYSSMLRSPDALKRPDWWKVYLPRAKL